ncbi:TPA: glycerophosphoryl diester phosphodiesterase membrane domain-containing protein [Staphylococcus pseudintermedius]
MWLNVSHSMKHSWQLTRRHPFKLISVILILHTALLLSIIVLIVISVSVFSIIDSQGQNWATASLLFILLKGIFFFGTVMTKLILVATLVYYLMDQQPIQKQLTVIPSRPYSWIVKLVLIAILIGVSISSVV